MELVGVVNLRSSGIRVGAFWGGWVLVYDVLVVDMKKGFVIIVLAGVAVCCFSFVRNKPAKSKFSFTGEPTTKEQLGEVLFFEQRLSSDGSISCASCHIPEFGFADTVAFSRGVRNKRGDRNTPSCANMSDRPYFFYDGRAQTLEEQVKFPIENPKEMNMPIASAVKRLNKDAHYVNWFQSVFKELPGEDNLKMAIAAYERTLETSSTPFERYMKADDSNIIGGSAVRGRELFMVKGKCFECHFTPDFTGDEFRNIGIFDGKRFNDSGRYKISRNREDIGKFKVPGLRNVAVTAPYMHNGMFKTLREVIDYYDNPYKIIPNPVNIDTLLAKPLNLTNGEKEDLEAFLLTLTDDRFKGRRKR